ncbi:MAG: hypothetical protein RJA70_2831 [Pseudomonadota bacterium]|jgi:hypothetical protein
MPSRTPIPSLGEVLARSRALNGNGHVNWQIWRQVVGTKVATRSRPENIDQGLLWVVVTSNTWAQELSLLRRTIVSRLGTHGIAVSGLRFRVGKVEPLRAPPARETIQPARLPSQFQDRLNRLDDPRLREVISEAAAYSLALQRR